jgi:hypothetical protein
MSWAGPGLGLESRARASGRGPQRKVRGRLIRSTRSAIGGGVVAALVIGAVAGLYPSLRAARLSPTEALRTV